MAPLTTTDQYKICRKDFEANARAVESLKDTINDHHEEIKKAIAQLDRNVRGTNGRPGLNTRVDRLERIAQFLTWFAAALVLTGLAIVGKYLF